MSGEQIYSSNIKALTLKLGDVTPIHDNPAERGDFLSMPIFLDKLLRSNLLPARQNASSLLVTLRNCVINRIPEEEDVLLGLWRLEHAHQLTIDIRTIFLEDDAEQSDRNAS